MSEIMSSLKYVIFFLTMGFGVPTGYYLCQRNKMAERIFFFLTIFFTVKMEDINLISRETEKLTSRGLEVGMVDICIMILFFVVYSNPHKKTTFPRGYGWFVAYFVLSLVSLVNADYPLFSLFEIWKMIRMFVFFWTMYNYLDSDQKFMDILTGIAAVSFYVFFEVFRQKYVYHKFQTPGPFPHQNSMVMYMIIFSSITFSYLINKKDLPFIKLMFWLGIFGVSSVAIISSLSRAGMVLYSMSIAIVLGISYLNKISMKKVGITILLLLMGVGVLIKAWDSIVERFETAPEESALTRVALAQAAVKMANDEDLHYLGVGLNNFGRAINPPYPYCSHIDMYSDEDKNGLVETIYLMIAAECGWHTLLIFFIMLFYYYFLNVSNAFKYKNQQIQFISIGLIGGLIAIYLESSLEWVLKQTNNFYQLMLIFAIITAMDREYKKKIIQEKRKKLHKRLINANTRKRS